MNNNGVGTSSVIARHDYLPFGEKIGANVGMRTGAQGYKYKNIPVFIIKNNLRSAGMRRERYFELLAHCR